MTHHANPTKILHTILENIAYKAESNDVTLYSVYPLTDTPRIQPIPRLYKNHLIGLFLELKLLSTRGHQLRTRSVDKWNELISQQSYTFNQSKINRKTTIELSVKPVNTLQVEKERGNKLTVADKLFLDELREKYIRHCNINDDASDRNDCASKKRCSASLHINAVEQEEEVQQSLVTSHSKNKRMRTYHVGTSKFAVNVPRQVHVQSVYSHTQLLSRLDTFEAENKKMRERIHELEAVHENETNKIEKLTLELGNAQITIDFLQ